MGDLTTVQALEIFTAPAVGLVGGLFALYRWRSDTRKQRELQAADLRWRQAQAAKKLLDELADAEFAGEALAMLDWDGLDVELANGQTHQVSEADYLRALRVQDLRFTDAEFHIRNCFDELFYMMAIMEHHIRTDLVRFEDVRFPLDYYVPVMNRNLEVFKRFLASYELDLARAFLDRMNEAIGNKVRKPWHERDGAPA